MDLAIFIPADCEEVGPVGVAEFDMMGNEPPVIHCLDHSSEFFASILSKIAQQKSRVWVGPQVEVLFDLEDVYFGDETVVLDAFTLLHFIPHSPYQWVAGGTPQENVARMVERIRGCVNTILTSGF